MLTEQNIKDIKMMYSDGYSVPEIEEMYEGVEDKYKIKQICAEIDAEWEAD